MGLTVGPGCMSPLAWLGTPSWAFPLMVVLSSAGGLTFAQPPPCLEQPLCTACLAAPGTVSSGLPSRSAPPAPLPDHWKTCAAHFTL